MNQKGVFVKGRIFLTRTLTIVCIAALSGAAVAQMGGGIKPRAAAEGYGA